LDLFDVSASAARRWTVLAAAVCIAAVSLDGCGRKAAPPSARSSSAAAAPEGSLEWAAAGDWRTGADRREDKALHPVETLRFFGLQPGVTVVDVWPGAGWWTGVIAPYLAANKGKVYAAVYEAGPDDPAATSVVQAYKTMIADKPAVYGDVAFTTFGPHSAALAPAGTADLVLFSHLDNWMAAGLAEKAFHDAFVALKPGGVLGVVQARGEPGGVQDPLAANGYVQEAFVKQMAAEAGFKFDKASEVDANPHDPRGRRALPFGKAVEPDRMALRFLKPKT
jgi:predicted methyltransferase